MGESCRNGIPRSSRICYPAGYGYGYAGRAAYPGFAGSVRLSDELKAEEEFLGARRQLYGDLRTAEASEAQAAEKLFQDQRNAEVRTSEAAEQSRRAATAEQIHARAMEEYRLREAEAKAAAAAAADAKALFERAAQAAQRAEEARNAEVAAAEKKAAEARTAEQTLSQSAATEQNTAATLSRLEADAAHRFGPVYGAGYGFGRR